MSVTPQPSKEEIAYDSYCRYERYVLDREPMSFENWYKASEGKSMRDKDRN